jgi:hypothetical protein
MGRHKLSTNDKINNYIKKPSQIITRGIDEEDYKIK